MTKALIDVLAWVLIPMGVLPVVTAIVLLRFVNSPSPALRERARLALLIGALGFVFTALAANRVWHWQWPDGLVALPLIVVLLLIDLAAGLWLIDYWRGRP